MRSPLRMLRALLVPASHSLRQRRIALLGARQLLAVPLALAGAALALQFLMTGAADRGGTFEQRLALRAMLDARSEYGPAQALSALQAGHAEQRVSNARHPGPFWLLVDVPGRPQAPAVASDVLLIGDRHLQSADVWIVDAAGRLGERLSARRGLMSSAVLAASPLGFVLRLDDKTARPARVLAQVTALGSAEFTALHQDIEQFERTERRMERSAGLLVGAFTALALFAAVVAWQSRSRVFALFVSWLMVAGALAGITLGYDYVIIDAWPGPAIEAAVKQLVVAGYATLSLSLFIALFRRSLAMLRLLRPLRWLQRAAAGTCVLSALLPPPLFLPLMWSVGGVALAAGAVALVRIQLNAFTPHARWYGAAWLAQLVAAAAEVVYATGLLPRIPGVSFENGALVGALLTGAALVERMGDERRRRLQAQLKAEQSARHYRQIYNAAPGGMMRLTTDGRVMQMNRLARGWLQLDMQAEGLTEGLTVEDAFGLDKARRLLAEVMAKGRASLEIVRLHNGPGGRQVRTFALEATRDGSDIAVALSDVSDRVELARTLHNMTMRDPLTQLLNRRGLEKNLDEVLARVAAGRPSCFAHVDLDRFKLINDVFGHVAGDIVLQTVANRLRRGAPPNALTARLGSDEFVVVLPDHDVAAARNAADKLIADLTGAPVDVGVKTFEIAASVGVVEISAQMSVKDVFACADRACMQAKQRGRGTVVSYAATDGTLSAYQEDVRLADGLRSGAVLSRLALYGQPLVPIQAERPAAIEVLLRVKGDDGRMHAPGNLIAAAERAGEMATVDRFVLSRTLEHLSTHPTHAQALDFCAVNLSGASLNDARFVADACAMLAEHAESAKRMCLEITESVALYDIENTRRFIEAMRRLDVRVALDDFGAGYTSFVYLKDLQAQYIKIDGAFVRDLLIQPTHRAITESIVELTHKLKMESIAEWIEDEATMQALRAMGADFGQGYFFSPAMPLEAWLSMPVPRAPPGRASNGVLPFPGRAPASEPRNA